MLLIGPQLILGLPGLLYAAGLHFDPIQASLHNITPLEPELRNFNPTVAGWSNAGTAQPSAGPLTFFTPSGTLQLIMLIFPAQVEPNTWGATSLG